MIENIAREDGMGMPHGISHMEVLFWVWSLCRFLDELVQLAAAPRFWSYFRNVGARCSHRARPLHALSPVCPGPILLQQQ